MEDAEKQQFPRSDRCILCGSFADATLRISVGADRFTVCGNCNALALESGERCLQRLAMEVERGLVTGFALRQDQTRHLRALRSRLNAGKVRVWCACSTCSPQPSPQLDAVVVAVPVVEGVYVPDVSGVSDAVLVTFDQEQRVVGRLRETVASVLESRRVSYREESRDPGMIPEYLREAVGLGLEPGHVWCELNGDHIYRLVMKNERDVSDDLSRAYWQDRREPGLTKQDAIIRDVVRRVRVREEFPMLGPFGRVADGLWTVPGYFNVNNVWIEEETTFDLGLWAA